MFQQLPDSYVARLCLVLCGLAFREFAESNAISRLKWLFFLYIGVLLVGVLLTRAFLFGVYVSDDRQPWERLRPVPRSPKYQKQGPSSQNNGSRSQICWYFGGPGNYLKLLGHGFSRFEAGEGDKPENQFWPALVSS